MPQIGPSSDCAANPSTTNDITRPKNSGRVFVMISAWLTSRTPVEAMPTRIASSIMAKNEGASPAKKKTSANSNPNPISSGQARRPVTIPANGTLAINETTPTIR